MRGQIVYKEIMTIPLMRKPDMALPESQDVLLRAVRRLLRPLVRLLIVKNVPLQMLLDVMKEVYVSVAEESLRDTHIKATDSQISLMTGVHRKDVRRYRDNSSVSAPREMPHVSIGAEVVVTWTGNPQFVGADGQPCPLPYTNRDNPGFSFSALAQSVSTDVRPRAILDEMLRQNAVRYDAVTDQVWLNAEAFIPQEGWGEKLYYLGRNGEDHLEAAVTNVLSLQPPFLDRAVFYGGLTEKSAEELRALAEENAMKSLRAVNRRAFALAEEDKGKPEARARVTFGAYFYTAPDREEE
jgi:hypothetical protein